MAAYEVLLLNTAIPQIQAAQSGDTYVCPRDIAFSAALTLSAGTANGVPYLNGSKVLTTGSALTFDGNTLKAPNLNVTDGNWVGWGSDRTRLVGNSATNFLAAFIDNSEQMRLTSTGLGIGTNNPAAKLDVQGTSLRLNLQSTSNGQYATWKYVGKTSTGAAVSFEQGINVSADNAFEIYDNTNTQNVSRYLSGASGYWQWFTNGTERARITSDGNFLVGGVTDNSTGNVLVTSSSIGFIAGAATPQINYYSSASTIEYVNRDSGGSKTFSWYYQASAAGSPATLSTSGVWTNASDARGKENIEDINYGLAQVLALQPRQYDVKSDNSHAVGFVAQEVQPLIPELVHVTRRDENDEYYGLDYGSMTAVLVKAIQEQQAMINELKAEVAALKGA